MGWIRMKKKNRLTAILVLLALIAIGGNWYMLKMPGVSYRGSLPPLNAQQLVIRDHLATHIEELANKIGERNVENPKNLEAAANYIEILFKNLGYAVSDQSYEVYEPKKVAVRNLIAEYPGTSRSDEIIVIGAHYDSVVGSPGADDNGSGVAAMLELARLLKSYTFKRTIRFVAFVNEEPPFFYTKHMGSLQYARLVKQKKENIIAMISLESLGYYSEQKHSQHYPFPFGLLYPNTGDFIGFVGNLSSRDLVGKVVSLFRQHSQFPSEGAALPSWMRGVSWSDQWSFWKQGYQAIMVTGTAVFRNPNYHLGSDLPDTIDYARTARVVDGLQEVVKEMGGVNL